MKKILLMLFTLSIIVGCKKESDNYFDAMVDAESLSFRAVQGGAIMTYTMPESKSIYGINVNYTSTTGEKMTVAGTYGSTELSIKGFIEGEDMVPATVRYVSRDNRLSKPINVTFSTLPAGAVSIFDNIKVAPYWGGFSVTFDAPENVDGLINIGYMGINPSTGKPGVILKETRVISAGENKLLYNNIVYKQENIKAVIWTEDIFQNEAKRAEYDIMPKMTKRVDPSKLSYSGESYEYTFCKFSKDYLFDGDTNGVNSFQNKNGAYFFITYKDIGLKPEGIIDLGEAQTIAYFRYYAPLNNSLRSSAYIRITDGAFPNHFKLFASNNINASAEEWVEVGEYNQSKTQNDQFWWCFPQFDPSMEYKDVETLAAAPPCYVDVNFEVSETKYRYLKIQFLNTFKDTSPDRRAQCSEMEVFVEK